MGCVPADGVWGEPPGRPPLGRVRVLSQGGATKRNGTALGRFVCKAKASLMRPKGRSQGRARARPRSSKSRARGGAGASRGSLEARAEAEPGRDREAEGSEPRQSRGEPRKSRGPSQGGARGGRGSLEARAGAEQGRPRKSRGQSRGGAREAEEVSRPEPGAEQGRPRKSRGGRSYPDPIGAESGPQEAARRRACGQCGQAGARPLVAQRSGPAVQAARGQVGALPFAERSGPGCPRGVGAGSLSRGAAEAVPRSRQTRHCP